MLPRLPADPSDPDLDCAELRLAALPGAVSCGRRFIRSHLAEWDLDALSDTCTVVGSELITNAVAHTGGMTPPSGYADPHDRPLTTITVRLRRTPARLLCEVHDRSPAPPVPRTAGALDEGGRGLLLVAACSTDWGYFPLPRTGKVVWSSWSLAPS